MQKRERKKIFNIEYKSPVSLHPFLSEGGKINPGRITGLKYSQQRQLRTAVKKARRLSLLPASAGAYDDFGPPEPLSIKPFKF